MRGSRQCKLGTTIHEFNHPDADFGRPDDGTFGLQLRLNFALITIELLIVFGLLWILEAMSFSKSG